jgi:hypothetical protein
MYTMSTPIEFNKTVSRTYTEFAFDGLSREELIRLYRDGRISSHFMEVIIGRDSRLTHVGGCKDHDLVDPSNSKIKYEQKTFTSKGCKLMPSSMIGTKRKFDKKIFDEKVKDLNYVIVSVLRFPEVHTRFVKGSELATLYPNGVISVKKHDSFFELTSQ